MSRLKIDYHTHNRLCNHAVGEAEDYIKEAINLEMNEIGLSDHCPFPESFLENAYFFQGWIKRTMTLSDYHNIYLPEIKDVKKRHKKEISIKFGLEAEYLPNHNDFYLDFFNDLDYLNLGVHFFEKDGKFYNTYHDINYTNVGLYADACIEAMETGYFSILCHPDLFMWDYKNALNANRFDNAAGIASERIIEAAIRTNTILEINANGFLNSRRGKSKESGAYPNTSFWAIASNYKELKIIIGADSHKPSDLSGEHIDSCFNLVKRFKLKLVNSVTLKNPLKKKKSIIK